MMNFSILVCDDSAVARKQVIRCLNDCITADIRQAINGVDALALLKEQHFDLVCLDLTMPILDGVQASVSFGYPAVESQTKRVLPHGSPTPSVVHP